MKNQKTLNAIIIFNPQTFTNERGEEINYSQPYLKVGNVCLAIKAVYKQDKNTLRALELSAVEEK